MQKDLLFEFIGDSVTHGGRRPSMDCNHLMGHGFPEMAAADLGRDHLAETPRFVNRGVSGQGVAAVAERWQQDVVALRPDFVTLLVGVNDSTQYDPAPWEETYRRLLDDTRAALPDCRILLIPPFYFPLLPHEDPYRDVPHPTAEPDFPIPSGANTPELCARRLAAVTDMQETVRRLASEYGAVLVPAPEALARAAQEAPLQYVVWDGVHPTVVGHRLLADAWLSAVRPLL